MNATYPIIANCNFESRDDETGRAIHEIRKAIEAGLVDDESLAYAMDGLESTLEDHADSGSDRSVALCREAESDVLRAWTSEVQASVEEARLVRYCS